MGVWWLAVKDLLLMIRDWKALLTMVLMPLLLIGILGASFGNIFTEESDIPSFTMGVANKDDGNLGSSLIQDVFLDELASMGIKVKEMTQEELAEKMEKQEYPVGLVIPESFSSMVMAGQAADIKIYSPSDESIPAMVVENVVHQYTLGAGVQLEGARLLAEKYGQDSIPVGGASEPDGQAASLTEEVAVGDERRQVDSFQYYAAGMGVMFLLITVVIVVEMMVGEKGQEVYKRLLVSRLSSQQYLAGKLLGLLLITSLQFAVMILGTYLLFGVHWGDSLAGVFWVGLAFAFSASCLGILAGSFAKSEKSFGAMGTLGTQLLAAAGGSMVPLYLFPDWLNSVMTVFPNALALQSFLELMSGASLGEQMKSVIQLIALGCLFLIASWFKMTLERRKLHA